ncbi:MAG: hypothetical protein QF769_04830 [Candidatus Marinimicrobia bacterium]|nr:hypothetical protein [Candidatus Neomarinimicrobiota bacterium]
MNLKLIFRIYGGISAFNAVAFVLLTETFLEAAGVAVTPETITLGQGLGIMTFFVGLLSWRTPDIAGDAINDYGQLFSIGMILLVGMIGYHVLTGLVGGPPAYVNLGANVVLAALFFIYSKK